LSNAVVVKVEVSELVADDVALLVAVVTSQSWNCPCWYASAMLLSVVAVAAQSTSLIR
jgi:hypothetical protein